LYPQLTQCSSFGQLSTVVPEESQRSVSKIDSPKPVFRNRKFTPTFSKRNENKSGSNLTRLSLKKAKAIQRVETFPFGDPLRASRLVTPRTVPEGSDSIQLATVGDTSGLQRMFHEGTAFASESSLDNWSLLHFAAFLNTHRTYETVSFLLKCGANPDAMDVVHRKPAHLAFVRYYSLNATDIDRQCLYAFPDWRDYRDDFDFTSLHLAALDDYPSKDKTNPSLEDLLTFVEDLNNSPKGQDWSRLRKQHAKTSPLRALIVSAFREDMLKSEKDPNFDKPYVDLVNKKDSRQCWTPLQWAVQTGRLSAAKILIRHLADPFIKTTMGRNLLHQAAESGSLDMMKYVLSITKGPTKETLDVNLQDYWGETPLHVSIYRNSPECVELLLKRGARVDLETDEAKQTPLHFTSISNSESQTRIVDLLSREPGECLNRRDNRGRPPIFLLVSNTDAIAKLLKRGVDLSLEDNVGSTILHVACSSNNAATLKILLDSQLLPPDLPLRPDKKGFIPLETAFTTKSADCASLLVKCGAIGDLNTKEDTTLVHRAVILGQPDLLEVCFKHVTFRKGTKTREGLTIQKLACKHDVFKEAVRQLILKFESFDPESEDL
jgi:ankyrin repeat protein